MKREGSQSETSANFLARKGITGTVGQVTSRALSFGFLLLLARLLNTHDYGLFILGWTIVLLAQSISTLGLQKGLVRLIAKFYAESDIARVRGTILTSVVFSTMMATAIALAIVFSAPHVATTIFQKPRLELVLSTLALLIPFGAFIVIAAAISQSFQKITVQQIVRNTRALLLLIFAGLTGVLGYEFGYILIAIVLSGVAASVVVGFIVWRSSPISLRGPRSVVNRRLLEISIPMFLSGFIYSLLFRIDQLILGVFVTASEVGFYNAGSVLASQLSVVLIGIAAVFEPTASKLYTNNNNGELASLFNRVAVWALIATTPIAAVLWGFPELLLSFFGTAFVTAESILLILTLYMLFRTAIGPTGELLNMTGHQKLVLYDTSAMVLLNVALNLVLIPIYGGVGAAVATTVSIVSVELLVLYQVYSRLQMHPFNRSHGLAIILCAAFLGASVSLNWYDLHHVIRAGVMLVLFAGYSYLVWNIVLNREERNRLNEALNTVWL